ncbi:hypothetical protein NDU88_002742 [Pleurodeles waltl]|uniref:Uncharacterized protein n=1 Tax=Pleurodeles waltl TaxID=8319 RepID=A0AAV7W306_PLEWA|nr:hypothetical protein NDU88_002742 [Pleurodeles waltl]
MRRRARRGAEERAPNKQSCKEAGAAGGPRLQGQPASTPGTRAERTRGLTPGHAGNPPGLQRGTGGDGGGPRSVPRSTGENPGGRRQNLGGGAYRPRTEVSKGAPDSRETPAGLERQPGTGGHPEAEDKVGDQLETDKNTERRARSNLSGARKGRIVQRSDRSKSRTITPI